MKVNIVSVGKLNKEFKVLFDDYKKKIEFYATLNEIEIKAVKDDNKDIQIKKETEAILKVIPKNSRVIYCSTTGSQKTSKEFSNYFDEDNITFVIGGSHGVDESQFKEKINFSKMTFPHQMFKVMLTEQIFRAFAIRNNSNYHK